MAKTERSKQVLSGVVLAASAAVVVYGLFTVIRNLDPDPLLESVDTPGAPEPSLTIDENFALVAERVPAFGGMYVDGDRGRLNIWLTDGEKSLPKATRVLLDVFEGGGLDELKPVALDADYSFTELAGWYRRLGSVYRMNGVFIVHLEPARNRITVGVENLDVQEPLVEAELTRLGVPLEAVVIE